MIGDRNCRLCTSPNDGSHLNIFSAVGSEMQMYEIIIEHFKCEISETDSMPNFVCQICWSITDAFHELYKKSKSAQERFLHQSIKCELFANDLWQQNNKEITFIDESQVEVGLIKVEPNAEGSDANDAQMDYDGLRESDESTDVSENEKTNNEKECGNGPEPKHPIKHRQLSSRKIARIKNQIDFENYFSEHKHYFDMTCDSCSKTFETFDEARRHYASEHNSKGYIKCCGSKLMYRGYVRQHLKQHLEPESLKCKECGKLYAWEYQLQNHMENHRENPITKKRNITCDICKKVFISKSSVVEHLKKHMERGESENTQYNKFMEDNFDMKCDVCENVFTSFYDARDHYKEQHNDNKGYLKCCKSKLRTFVSIKEHISYHLNPESFKCETCNKSFVTRQNLVKHKRRHRLNTIKTYICDYCDRSFKDKFAITRHLYNKHVDLEPKFNCDICHKKYKTPLLLKDHKYTVHREKKRSNTCEKCGKSFYTMFHLKKHLLSHTDQSERLTQRKQCEHCGEWLLTKSGIFYHQQIHTTGVQTCQHCQMELPNRVSLLNHIRAHHREKKHKCSYCSRTFAESYSMKEHEESHTRHNVYQCKFCPKTFTVQSSRKTHTRRNHREDMQEK